MAKEGILLCGHGSRRQAGIDAFKKLVEILTERYSEHYEVDYGFLEFSHPLYEAAVERLYHKGVRKIYALPVILFAGGHAKNDIPYEMNTIQTYYDDLKITMGRPIGASSFLVDLACKRLQEAEERAAQPVDRQDTCLMVVGRGTTDPDSNSDVHKLMSMIWEGMGYGFGTVAYSGTAHPRIPEALEMLHNMPFKRIACVPFFFFTGVLLERIYEQVQEFEARSDKELLAADAFGHDELILKAFDERLEQAREGIGSMNCQMCKYRKQIVGFEQNYGEEQIGHHLNVKGVLFEEEEKVGEKKDSIGKKVKNILGI